MSVANAAASSESGERYAGGVERSDGTMCTGPASRTLPLHPERKRLMLRDELVYLA